MSNYCQPTNITTDETPLPCNNDFTDWNCVLVEDDYVFLGKKRGASVKDIIVALTQEVENLKAKVDLNLP